MNATTLERAPATADRETSLGREAFEQWLAACNRFAAMQQQERLIAEAPPEVAGRIDAAHKFLLRFTRLMNAQLHDPEFGDAALAQRFECALWRLEQAWAVAHNPMSEAESDALAAKLFPDEPGA